MLLPTNHTLEFWARTGVGQLGRPLVKFAHSMKGLAAVSFSDVRVPPSVTQSEEGNRD